MPLVRPIGHALGSPMSPMNNHGLVHFCFDFYGSRDWDVANIDLRTLASLGYRLVLTSRGFHFTR